MMRKQAVSTIALLITSSIAVAQQPNAVHVRGTIEGKDHQTLDGEKTFEVSPNVTVVTFAPATEADLKPGEKVFSAAANKLPDGTIVASNITVGRNGINPPM